MASYTFAARRNQNLYRSRSAVAIGPMSGRFVGIAVVAMLALLYLTQITKTSVFGTKLNSLKSQAEQLSSQKRDLEIEAARLQSINNLQNSTVAKGMVSEGNPTFIK